MINSFYCQGLPVFWAFLIILKTLTFLKVDPNKKTRFERYALQGRKGSFKAYRYGNLRIPIKEDPRCFFLFWLRKTLWFILSFLFQGTFFNHLFYYSVAEFVCLFLRGYSTQVEPWRDEIRALFDLFVFFLQRKKIRACQSGQQRVDQPQSLYIHICHCTPNSLRESCNGIVLKLVRALWVRNRHIAKLQLLRGSHLLTLPNFLLTDQRHWIISG